MLWPLCIAAGLPFAFGACSTMPLLLGLLVSGLICGLPTILFFAAMLIFDGIRRRHWLRAISAFLLPVIIVAAPFAPQLLLRPFYVAGVWIGCLPVYPFVARKVAALPKSAPRQLSFDLGYAGPFDFTLIYDETDRIRRSLGDDLQKGDLMLWLDDDHEADCWGNSLHLISHYYYCIYGLES